MEINDYPFVKNRMIKIRTVIKPSKYARPRVSTEKSFLLRSLSSSIDFGGIDYAFYVNDGLIL